MRKAYLSRPEKRFVICINAGEVRIMRSTKSKLWAVTAVWAMTVLLAVTSPNAQQGGTTLNGSVSADPNGNLGLVPKNGFLFEPEVPLASLKTVPIWNELEQLLDNPYNVALCSSLPLAVDELVRNTPGTTQITGSPTATIYPAYCTTAAVVRPPGVRVTVPPLLVLPLNFYHTYRDVIPMVQ